MGCHGSWANNSSNLPNGLLPGTKTYVGRVIDEEIWSKAEDSIAELIARIQPDESAEERRKAIAYSIQSVIGKCFSCQVKIIKCLAEDNVVDISCNQIGGLGTLCFLKKMDNLINQDHLFKRSVILIKAWCYYESHILGARRGIVSTYALETLILYIFHVFDNSLSGQLETNLGRSVSKGNLFRICSAFAFGSKSLARLLECLKKKMLSELTQFFMNTWKGHGVGIHTNASILGKKYHLCVHNVGTFTSLNFRIQSHNLLLMETEGSYTVQQNYTDFNIHVGQSYSFLIAVDQNTSKYFYIIASSHFMNASLWSRVTGIAVLHYSSSQAKPNGPLPDPPNDQFYKEYSMNQARYVRWNLSASAAKPNPQGYSRLAQSILVRLMY